MNMNEHTSLVVYIGMSALNDNNILSISQTRELKIWNFITGVVEQSHVMGFEGQIVAVDINNVTQQGFFALTTRKVVVYSLQQHQVL
jgi:hypothetical protein